MNTDKTYRLTIMDPRTYRISEKRKLWRVCAYAQTHQSFRRSHEQSTDVDEGSDQTLYL